MKLESKTAIITGGGTGIGRAIAVLFANEGASVVIANRTTTTGEETVRQIEHAGGTAEFVMTDVTRVKDVQALITKTVSRFGRLDVLVNNAGFWDPKPLLDLDETSWDRAIDVNLKGTYLCTRFAAAEFMEQQSGIVINVSSPVAISALESESAYAAAKAGVLALTRVWALELARGGVRVNCLVPGPIDTPMMWQGLDEEGKRELREATEGLIPLARVARPQEVAQAALFLASDDSSFITGTSLNVDGGQLAVLSATSQAI